MRRTTIFADEEVLRKLREIAKRENITLSNAIRTALQRYARAAAPSAPASRSSESGGVDAATSPSTLKSCWVRDSPADAAGPR